MTASPMIRRLLPRRFPPTREGWWFLVATLLIGAAAVNGGINLMFLIFGMMLFLILASGIMSELCLRDLTVTRRPPAAIHAGSPYLMGVCVRNDKRRVPTFSLEVEDLVAGRPVDRRCYYLKLPATRAQETAYRHVLHRRGYHRLTGFRISTRFPFGLIRKSRDIDAPVELLVYPALVPVPEDLIPTGLAQSGRRNINRKSRSGEFHGLREFREGDDPRAIHWRTTARRGRPFIRELEDESSRLAIVVLEDATSSTTGPAVPAEAMAPFESAVSLAASLAIALLKRGFRVGLQAGDSTIAPDDGPNHTTQLLRFLALVVPAKEHAPSARPSTVLSGATRFQVSAGEPTARLNVIRPAAAQRSA